jgi:hypothetical protein
MTTETIDIGSRRELMVDHFLIEHTEGVALQLQKPVAREVAIVHDAPWEGNISGYHTIFRDGDLYRMYYRGSHFDEATAKQGHPEVTCYAESRDGIHWEKPELGLVEFAGSKANNIVLQGGSGHCFAPFKDGNPNCAPDARYKAFDRKGTEGLHAFKSADGINWSFLTDELVITEGAFDSQNVAFWDAERGRYVDFHRHFYERDGQRIRAIMTCYSEDFVQWSDPQWIEFPDVVEEQLYTNQVVAYHRAPHLFLGFPKRFVPDRTSVEHNQKGVSDGVFMSSRDGVSFARWTEAFIRPGLQPERWVTRNNMTAWGIVETRGYLDNAPDELSIYSTEHYYRGEACKLRRFALRTDGFVAANAPLSGGELLTKNLRFAGNALYLNFSTSAAGSVRVEVQGEDGRAVEGYALADCTEIYGDEIERKVIWRGGDLSALAGKALRLRFVLRDADLFALRFA